MGQARNPMRKNLYILFINNIGYPKNDKPHNVYINLLLRSLPAGYLSMGRPCIRHGGPFPFPLLLVDSSYNVFLGYISHKACSYTQGLVSVPFAPSPAIGWWEGSLRPYCLCSCIACSNYFFLLFCISHKVCIFNLGLHPLNFYRLMRRILALQYLVILQLVYFLVVILTLLAVMLKALHQASLNSIGWWEGSLRPYWWEIALSASA